MGEEVTQIGQNVQWKSDGNRTKESTDRFDGLTEHSDGLFLLFGGHAVKKRKSD